MPDESTPPSQPREPLQHRLERWWTSAATRFLAASILGLLLLLPIAWIGGLVENRETYRELALQQMRAQWGSVVEVGTPWLEVETEGGATRLAVLATSAVSTSQIDSELRRRGSFESPVFHVDLDMQLNFDTSQLPDDLQIDWPTARLVFELSDPARIEGALTARANDVPLNLERKPRLGILELGAVLEAGLELQRAPTEPLEVAVKLRIAGSTEFQWLPLARESLVEISSDWSTPAFGGDWLPTQRALRPDGFRAEWTLAPLARGLPTHVDLVDGERPPQLKQMLTVGLHKGVSEAQQIERSLKYALLFVVITFGGIWGFEMQTGRILHPLHYLCSGLALIVFFLLELSITEQLGFTLGYSLAATAIVTLLAWYGRGILGSQRRAFAFAGMIAALFAYLFGVLSHGQSSLLAGSLLVLALLAWIMKCTRWVAWHDRTERSGS